RGNFVGGDLGSALPLPDVPAALAHANPHGQLDPHSAGPTAHRIYLPVRSRYPEGGRSTDHRSPGSGLGTAPRHVERTGFARRFEKIRQTLGGKTSHTQKFPGVPLPEEPVGTAVHRDVPGAGNRRPWSFFLL